MRSEQGRQLSLIFSVSGGLFAGMFAFAQSILDRKPRFSTVIFRLASKRRSKHAPWLARQMARQMARQASTSVSSASC